MIIQTLCLIYQPPRLLLGLKKRGFGQGRWNGFGGKIEVGETLAAAAIRETQEEAGIIVSDITKRGVLFFEFKDGSELIEVHVFSTSNFKGEIIETEEMKPHWFNLGEIPIDQMWPDDKYWLPLFLAGKNFSGHFYFRDVDTLVDYTIQELS